MAFIDCYPKAATLNTGATSDLSMNHCFDLNMPSCLGIPEQYHRGIKQFVGVEEMHFARKAVVH